MIRYYCSGFDINNCFGHGIAEMIKRELTDTKNIVFVTGNPDRQEKINFDKDVIVPNFINSFENNGIKFGNEWVYITPDTDMLEAQEHVKNASLLFLLGGNPNKQKVMCENLGILGLIKNNTEVIIGMSSGAMLMSKYIIDTTGENIVVEDGLNLDNISIYPHNNTSEIDYPNEIILGKNIYRKKDLIIVAQQYGEFYLLQDNKLEDGSYDISIIKSTNGNIEYYTENDGKIWKVNGEEVRLFVPELSKSIKR